MSLDIWVLIFLLLTVVSSLISKVRSKGPLDSPRQRPKRHLRTPGESHPDVEDWDVFGPDVLQVPTEGSNRELAEAESSRSAEFGEASVQRRTREDSGSERAGGDREVSTPPAVARPATEPQAILPPRPDPPARRPERRGPWLKIGPETLARGIVFAELLGPPRGESMPW